jgi:hypothetical protein
MKEAQRFIELREKLVSILDESLKDAAYDYAETKRIATGGSDDYAAWCDLLRKVAEEILDNQPEPCNLNPDDDIVTYNWMDGLINIREIVYGE